MNSCIHKKDIISYQMGLLHGAKKDAFEEHLKTCTSCQKELQLEGVMEKELSTRMDPGNIETFVISKVRLLKNMRPTVSWQYAFQVGAYVLTSIILLWIFLPMFIALISAGGEGVASILENIPAPQGPTVIAVIIGYAALLITANGLLVYRTLRE